MSKKISGLFLSLTLVATLFAGCSSSSGNGGASSSSPTPAPGQSAPPAAAADYGDTGGLKLPLVDKPVTLTWMLASDVPNLNDSFLVKEIEKRTGIKLDIQAVSSATYKDKLKAVQASGKLPDLFHGLTPPEVNKLGADGAVVPINKYLDQLPNFKKLYVDDSKNSWVMKTYADDKGDIYTWPIYGVNRDVNHGFLYRKDIFDKNGIKEWTNTEEFYQALKKLKEIYPKSYPVASKGKEAIFKDWAFGWGVNGGAFPASYDEKEKAWQFAPTQPAYKEMLDFMKKLYAEGLLDQEFLTDTQDSWTAKMTANDRAFVTFDWIGRLDLFYNQIKAQNPDYDLRYGNPVGPTGHIRTLSKIDNFGLTVSNGKNKEAALKLLDYLASPSGATLVTMGAEGVTFKVDSAGKIEYPELKDAPQIDISLLSKKYGLWLEGMYLRADNRSVYYNFTPKEQEAQDKMKKGNLFEPEDPKLNFNAAETAAIAELQPALLKASQEFSAKYILSKNAGDKEWQDWLKNAEKLGAGKYAEVYNASQKRYDAAK